MEHLSFAGTVLETIEGRLIGVHTMLPGKVVKVDVAAGKCDVQPLLMRLGADGTPKTLPVITNCPIGNYRAGKAAVFLPLKVGDGVEIRFCERSLDVWLSKGGTVDPKDARKHNLSDAVAYPGLYPFTDPPVGADPAKLVIVNDKSKISLEVSGAMKMEADKGIVTLGADGAMTFAGESSSIEMTADGKFLFQGASDEILATIILLIDKLVAANQLDPLTGLQPAFDPATITQLNTVKTKFTGLKG